MAKTKKKKVEPADFKELDGPRDQYGRLKSVPGLPQFLRDAVLSKPPLTPAEEQRLIDLTTGRARDWAPIRKPEEWTVKPTMPMVVDNPNLPVKVQVKDGKRAGSTLLATYKNMAEFEAKHDKKNYPLRGQPVLFENHTVVLCSKMFWVDKNKDATKRVGPKASTVYVDGTEYGSVLQAFQALALPVPKHQKFRAELKQKRTLAFLHDGKSFTFSYDADAKPVAPPAPPAPHTDPVRVKGRLNVDAKPASKKKMKPTVRKSKPVKKTKAKAVKQKGKRK